MQSWKFTFLKCLLCANKGHSWFITARLKEYCENDDARGAKAQIRTHGTNRRDRIVTRHRRHRAAIHLNSCLLVEQLRVPVQFLGYLLTFIPGLPLFRHAAPVRTISHLGSIPPIISPRSSAMLTRSTLASNTPELESQEMWTCSGFNCPRQMG